MFFSKKKPGLALLLALSIVLTGIPFPGNVNVVNATEVETETSSTSTSEATVDVDIMSTDFNDATLGASLASLSGTNWTGGCNEGNYTGYSKVVAKNTISEFSSADANDYCIEFTPLTSTVRALDMNFSIVLNDDVKPTTGAAVTENQYVVVEMDLAVTGSDTKANGFGINLNGGARTSNPSYLRLLMDDDSIGTSLTSSTSAAEGGFGHLKAVINRETEAVTWFWNGALIASDAAANHGSDVTNFGHIRFQIKYETSDLETTDSRLYVDNVKVYLSDVDQKPTPEPTAEPTPDPTAEPTATPAPTYTPYVIDTTFDEYALNTQARYISGDYFTSSWSLSYHHDRGK
ncbi:MAG: PT domain-containing protein, partial [Lachnospiraceae bacterium]|nr:PT domain-containing protein [Lachnospiraceae bacterium]